MSYRESVSSCPWPAVASREVAVQALLEQAAERWTRGGREGVAEAAGLCRAALDLLAEGAPEERARVWLRLGQILESGRTPEQLREAVRSQEAGLAALGGRSGGTEPEGEPQARLRALLWMNRGNALLAQAQADGAREALRSYAETLSILAEFSPETAPAELRAMAGAAWLNRGAAARLGLPGADGAREEERCLENAIRELTAAAVAGLAPARRNLAGAWLNRAASREAAGDADGARAAWREAARAAEPEARRDAVALETSLRARHAICVFAGKGLASSGDAAVPAAELAELFAQVEAGLADFAAWNEGAEASRETAARMFEFGAWLHRTREPRGLAAFLAKHADAKDLRRVEAARAAIRLAQQEILRTGFAEWLDEAGRELRDRLRDLQAMETRLSGRDARATAARDRISG